MEECRICPRNCGADRKQGKTGVCQETNRLRVARAALHMWEEPCISGKEGSGTVFFTGCNLRCVYCQNYELSRSRTGKEITESRLAEIFLELQDKGANNINLVTPTHFIPQILRALQSAKSQGLCIPTVYNSSGYECVDSLKMLEGLVDIYLPDFKYWNSETAERYCAAADYPAFVKEAIKSKTPVDLGSRCTVFMNSKIKQAQKEGYSVGDISSGLSYSVIKNAIQKVMKVRDVETLGKHIVVQGGTFYNDAVLRAFELIVGKDVVRPDISGLMGAYGMALLSKEQYEANLDMEYYSSILKLDELDNLQIKITHTRCNNCENHCKLTINKFSNGQIHVSGNRCEKGAGIVTKSKKLPNLVQYKYERIFDYKPLEEQYSIRGTIGIPRVLNMYEDYPFWFTFLTSLGFRVILSEKSNRATYEKGMESMPSESVCYPAKLSHGHIESLLEQGIKTIFYPCMPYSRKEYEKADNRYNCPIVISYSEVLKNNVEGLKDPKIKFLNPFLPFEKKNLVKKLLELDEFKQYNFTKKELEERLDAIWKK